MNLRVLWFWFLLIFTFSLKAQDTLKINIQQADSLFLKKNFLLLASAMHVEATKALIIQAKTYPNPVVTAEFNVYDPENDRTFHAGPSGQKSFQLEQLILIGGKRRNAVELAKTSSRIAELEFQQLLLQLKFRLHSNLFALGQLQIFLGRYNEQLSLLETLLSSYEIQAEKGNVPLKDVVRLKGAYLKLNTERSGLLKEYFEIQNTLQTLLQTTSVVSFEFSENDIGKYIRVKNFDELVEEAKKNRPELQAYYSRKMLAEQSIEEQKKQAIPDINLFTAYDQRGGAFNNQVNVGLILPVPIWNRNQGNIKASRYMLQEAEYNLQAKEYEMYSELHNEFLLYTQTVSEYQKVISLYNTDFETTVIGMSENFKKQNVSIIEFIDFFEAYNDVLDELIRVKTQLVISAERINLLTGKDIY